MTRYDIGIQTFWNVPNYGTYAQAYALQKVLQKLNDNKEVRQIAHLDRHHYDFYFDRKSYLRDFPVWKRAFWKSFLIRDKGSDAKEKTFLDAYEMIPHTETVDSNKVEEICFDKVFLGSDIVWDFSVEAFNNDPLLFGVGFNAEINSYAASFGTVKADAEIPQYVEEAIRKMKYISVRDEKSAEIVNRIISVYPEIVLDPAWLWDFDSDINIVKPEEDNYILVYGQDFTKGFIKNLVTYAKEKKMEIIALDCNDDHYGWCDKMIGQSNLSPFRWIGYFKYAAAVATSTFHGITFSLIFNKRFAFCKSDFIMAKIDQFLRELGLYELYDRNQDDVTRMLRHDFDYMHINKVIENKRKRSIEFLRKACDI